MDHATSQPRFFTVEEANRTLPLVRRIVNDIMLAYPDLRRQTEALHQLASFDVGTELEQRLSELRADVESSSARINGFIRELEQIGCFFKGFDDGLVDFYSVYKGKPVFLCWKYDEPRVEHYHDIEAGFTGRQPITPEIAAEIKRTLPGYARSN